MGYAWEELSPFIICSEEGCEEKTRSHSKPGWFYSRYGSEAYCPEHVPDWVEAWRKRKRQE